LFEIGLAFKSAEFNFHPLTDFPVIKIDDMYSAATRAFNSETVGVDLKVFAAFRFHVFLASDRTGMPLCRDCCVD